VANDEHNERAVLFRVRPEVFLVFFSSFRSLFFPIDAMVQLVRLSFSTALRCGQRCFGSASFSAPTKPPADSFKVHSLMVVIAIFYPFLSFLFNTILFSFPFSFFFPFFLRPFFFLFSF